MSFNHGAVWWSELMTRDVGAAVEYYRDVCGWSFDTMPMDEGGDYRVAIAHGEPQAGIADIRGIAPFREAPPQWFTYFAVDDVDAAVARTERLGGKVLRAPIDVPRVGRIGIVEDPTGARLGLMTPVFPVDALAEAEAAEDDGVSGEDNFPV